MTCELCHDSLRRSIPDDARAMELTEDPWEPCVACLSVPTDDELREVAREWDNRNPWHDVPRAPCAWYRKVVPVVPAYLPAGRHLLMWALSKRHCPSVSQPAFGCTFTNQHGTNGWEFWSEEGDDFVSFAPKHVRSGRRVSIPALADIPKNAPPDLRVARALVLCWEAK